MTTPTAGAGQPPTPHMQKAASFIATIHPIMKNGDLMTGQADPTNDGKTQAQIPHPITILNEADSHAIIQSDARMATSLMTRPRSGANGRMSVRNHTPPLGKSKKTDSYGLTDT